MRTEAAVIACNGDYATVETQRLSACEGCHKQDSEKGCSVCSLLGGEQRLSAKAKNSIGAAVGDRVLIESNTSRMLWYAVLIFLLPIFAALVGYAIAAWITASAAWQAIGALIGFCGTLVAAFAYSKYIQKNHCDIEIIAVLKPAPPEESRE